MCVLPGDAWTCDNLSTESFLATKSHESSGLIDPAQTSYLGYAQESPLPESYPIDGTSELGNVRLPATPYPLIEIADGTEKYSNNDYEKATKDTALPQAVEHRVENYLYQYFNGQQKIPTRNKNGNDNGGQENNVTWLRGFINKMLLYENVRVPVEQQVFSVVGPIARFGSKTCESSTENALRKNDYLNNIDSNILSYLVQSYILGRRQSMLGKANKNSKKTSSVTISGTTEASHQKDDVLNSNAASSSEQQASINTLKNGLKDSDNVIAVKGNLGGKEYVTIAKYKSLSTRVNVEVIDVVVCAKGIRLPNRTDCMKYYTCDPETATVVEFSCSPKTAFNDYNRVCEAQRYKACAKERLAEHEVTTTPRLIPSTQAPDLTTALTEDSANRNPCQSTGKFVDELSEKHYYVCYSSAGDSGSMEAIRMTCPSDLIFCQEKRVCTARIRCTE